MRNPDSASPSAAYLLGWRDRKAGHVKQRPIYPYSSDEYQAYCQGYEDRALSEEISND